MLCPVIKKKNKIETEGNSMYKSFYSSAIYNSEKKLNNHSGAALSWENYIVYQ
jgi:hypothetical protein